jgi:hypothetical protein
VIKRGSRLISDINDGVCSFLLFLSTINTITETMAKCDNNPDISFFINQFHILNYLHKKIINNNDTENDWMQYLFHPTDFGSITLSNYFSHFIRGDDDKLPLWLSLFITIKKDFPDLYKRISINNFEPVKGKPRFRKLMEDTFSLNIINLPSIEMTFISIVSDHLKSSQVTNPEIIKLISINTISNDELIDILSTMKPMILSIAHELIRNLNAGILISLRNRFTNIETINK